MIQKTKNTNLRFVLFGNARESSNETKAELYRFLRCATDHSRSGHQDTCRTLATVRTAPFYVEKARGEIREWAGLNFLADFCYAAGISLWEVHNKKPG